MGFEPDFNLYDVLYWDLDFSMGSYCPQLLASTLGIFRGYQQTA